MTQRWQQLLVSIGLLSLTMGCQKGVKVPVHPVRGAVMYKGKPAAGVVVVLRPLANEGSRPSSGTTAADGTFQITTFDLNDGAPAGEYIATMTWPKSQIDTRTGDELSNDLLNGRYGDPAKSSWKITVREGENVLDSFQLD